MENGKGKRSDEARSSAWTAWVISALALVCLAALPAFAQSQAGRQAAPRAQDDESLFSAIERIAREKEPDWKLEQRHERKGAEHKYFMHGWTLDKEYV